MSRCYMIGGVLIFGGLLLVGFQAISSMMTPGDIVWKSINIVEVVDTEYLSWIEDISWHSTQNAIKYITTMPLVILFLCLGSSSVLIGGFVDK